jgi:hypothetical protein
MKQHLATWILVVGTAVVPVWLGGCGGREEAAGNGRTPVAAPESGAVLPPGLFAPIDDTPVGIVDARATAAHGDRVVLRGMVGGRLDPFVAQRAVMILVDEGLPHCSGKTPWDMCGVHPQTIAAHSVTVEVNDAAGQPLRTSLRGQGGLEPMARVVVSGTVRRESDVTFVVTADRIHVASAE